MLDKNVNVHLPILPVSCIRSNGKVWFPPKVIPFLLHGDVRWRNTIHEPHAPTCGYADCAYGAAGSGAVGGVAGGAFGV